MKKFITVLAVVAIACVSLAKVRVVERVSDADGDATISITDYSRIDSIVCDVTNSGTTNTFTPTSTGIFTAGATSYTNTYEVAAQVVAVQGSEVVAYYNRDQDGDDETQWFKPTDTLTLTGSTQCVYRVVFEIAD